MILMWFQRRVYILPIFTTVFFFVTLLITYSIAVDSGSVDAFLPYISNTAIRVPERGIFGQLINIGSLLLLLNEVVRFTYINQILRHKDISRRWRRINVASLSLCSLSAFGLSMVANFQTDVMPIPHNIGAGMAFLCATGYCWTETSISMKLRSVAEAGRTKLLVAVQLSMSILATVLDIIFGASTSIYIHKYYRHKYQKMPLKTEDYMPVYLTSTVSEWLLAGTVVAFLLTFVKDFTTIKGIRGPRVDVERNQPERPAVYTTLIHPGVQTPDDPGGHTIVP